VYTACYTLPAICYILMDTLTNVTHNLNVIARCNGLLPIKTPHNVVGVRPWER